MDLNLHEITALASGVYLKPGINADALYLQAVHFDDFGIPDQRLKPQIRVEGKIQKHLLQEEDILFAAKGTHNFGVVYRQEFGKAVASSSFIVLRIKESYRSKVLPQYLAWFLSVTPTINALHQKQLGTTIPSISIKKLSKLVVKIPALKKQELIVKIYELRKLERDLKEQMDLLKGEKIQRILLDAMND